MSLANHEPFASLFRIIFHTLVQRQQHLAELEVFEARCRGKWNTSGHCWILPEIQSWDLAQSFSSGVPAEILPFLRLGRITVLHKPSGGIRGIMVGDTFRWLVARTINRATNQSCRGDTIPVRIDHQGRRGMRRSRDSDSNRPGPCNYSPVCKRRQCWKVCGPWKAGTLCSHLSPCSTQFHFHPHLGVWELCMMSFREKCGAR